MQLNPIKLALNMRSVYIFGINIYTNYLLVVVFYCHLNSFLEQYKQFKKNEMY